MRVAVRDAYGAVLNAYTGHTRVAGVVPDVPWAVYLADREARFRLLAFDLDAKTAPAAAAAQRDAEVLAGFLHDVGIAHVVCESGPGGGRHVWVGLADPVDASTVGSLARLVRHVCPTLDLSPLANPVTGCVRPPGAPHRTGGTSTVLTGQLDTLLSPTTTGTQVRALVERLARVVDDTEPAHRLEAHTPLPVDEHRRLYLPGPRRALPASSAAALDEDAGVGDASAVLWRVLIGAAGARWRHQDVAALVATAPGLEHIRTYRHRGDRRPRALAGPDGQGAVLARQWDKAVKYVATSRRQIGEDPTFDARADQVAEHVRHVQTRADATAGRWARPGGPADRRVLDVLCVLALQALSTDLEADTRRLALLAGIGRETARTALGRLAADGWTTRTHPGDGPHGARWTIGPAPAIHRSLDDGRSQADPRPAGAGPAERLALLATLTQRTADATHDLFTAGPGLGHLAGNVYARTSTAPRTPDELARATGTSPEQAAHTLEQLAANGVLIHAHGTWRRPVDERRHAAAVRLGVDGRLADRAHRYALERALWKWWQAEEAWMRAPHRSDPRRRPGPGQLSLLPQDGTNSYGAHPRRADGRADYRAARHQIELGRTHRAGHSPVTAAGDAEQLVAKLLGAIRVA